MHIIVGFTSRKKLKRSDVQSFILKKSQAKPLGLKKRNKNDILILSHITNEEYEQIKPAGFKNVVIFYEPIQPKQSEQLDLGI